VHINNFRIDVHPPKPRATRKKDNVNNQSMRQCAIGNHPTPWEDLYCYRDIPHGIPDDITICAKHLYEHCHKYYPGSPNELSLLDKYPHFREPEPVQAPLFA
jgi:hypothetical protein